MVLAVARPRRLPFLLVILAFAVVLTVWSHHAQHWLAMGQGGPPSSRPRTAPPERALERATTEAAAPSWEVGGPLLPRSTARVSIGGPPPLQPPLPMTAPAAVIVNGKDRAPSAPLVTGDGLRSLCAFVFDETSDPTLDVTGGKRRRGGEGAAAVAAARARYFARLQAGDTVFVKTELLDEFLFAVRGFIGTGKLPIRLVTHNSDVSAPWEPGNMRAKHGVGAYTQHRSLLLGSDEICSVWFAQNVVVQHPKLVPVPIGLENRYNRFGQHVEVYLRAAHRSKPLTARSGLLLMGFSKKTDPAGRGAALQAIQRNFGAAAGEIVTHFKPSAAARSDPTRRAVLMEYTEALQQHQFVLAPRGHGVDTHRLWEALYAGAVPVTLTSAMDAQLLHHLPVVTVRSFDEVTPALLRRVLSVLVEGGGGAAAEADPAIFDVIPFARKPPAQRRAAMDRLMLEYWQGRLAA